jgi:hypothetical protein
LFGKENSVTDLRPATGKRRRAKARNKIGPQGFDDIGNRELQKFRGLENQNVFRDLAEGHAKRKCFASEIFRFASEIFHS